MKRLVAIDTETTGLFWYKDAYPFLFIIAEEGKDTIVSKDPTVLIPYLEDDNCEIIFHNAKFDLSMLKNIGIEIEMLQGRVHDTTILMHLLFEKDNLSLDKKIL